MLSTSQKANIVITAILKALTMFQALFTFCEMIDLPNGRGNEGTVTTHLTDGDAEAQRDRVY